MYKDDLILGGVMMGKSKNLFCVVIACLMAAAAQAESKTGPRIIFPVEVVAPDGSLGDNTESGGIAFRQLVRAQKAVRINDEHIASFVLPGDKAETKIKLAAQTLFILARDESGEMYCAANASDTNVVATMLLGPLITAFHDVGICIRDSNADGTFDQEIVFDQTPIRTRTAYEIVGTKEAVWKSVNLQTNQIDPAQIPASEIHITFDYLGGGLFKKPRGVLHFALCWPQALVSVDAREMDGKTCANLGVDARGTGIDIGAGDGARSTIFASPFAIETVMNKVHAIKITVSRSLPPGPGLLLVTGRLWRPDRPKFQQTILDIVPYRPKANAAQSL